MGLVDIEHPEPVANWGIYDRSGLTALHWLVDPKSSVNTEYMAVCLDWIDKHSESLKGFSWHYRRMKKPRKNGDILFFQLSELF